MIGEVPKTLPALLPLRLLLVLARLEALVMDLGFLKPSNSSPLCEERCDITDDEEEEEEEEEEEADEEEEAEVGLEDEISIPALYVREDMDSRDEGLLCAECILDEGGDD